MDVNYFGFKEVVIMRVREGKKNESVYRKGINELRSGFFDFYNIQGGD